MKKDVINLLLIVAILTTVIGCVPTKAAPSAGRSADAKRLVPFEGEYLYTVKKGDCLAKLARWYYGGDDNWPFIAAANNFSNPNVIKVGETVKLPRLNRGMLNDWDRGRLGRSLKNLQFIVNVSGQKNKIVFQPYEARRADGDEADEEEITCIIENDGKKTTRFTVDSTEGGKIVSVEDVFAWRFSESEILLVVKTSLDHWAAGASESGKVHFFLLTPGPTVKRLLTVDGDGVQHHSCSSGESWETILDCFYEDGNYSIKVQHLRHFGETIEFTQEKLYNHTEESTRVYNLRYEPQRQELLKGQEFGETTERWYWEPIKR